MAGNGGGYFRSSAVSNAFGPHTRMARTDPHLGDGHRRGCAIGDGVFIWYRKRRARLAAQAGVKPVPPCRRSPQRNEFRNVIAFDSQRTSRAVLRRDAAIKNKSTFDVSSRLSPHRPTVPVGMWGDDELREISLWGFDHRVGDVGVRCFCFCADGQSVASGCCRTSETPTCSSYPTFSDNSVRRARQRDKRRQSCRRGSRESRYRLNAETATGPVQGYLATQSGTGTKTDTPLSQTAQSISVVSAERVRDQGVSSVQETLRYVPGVFAEPGGVDSRNDYFEIAARIRTSISTTTVNVAITSTCNGASIPICSSASRFPRARIGALWRHIHRGSRQPDLQASAGGGLQRDRRVFDNFGRKQVQIDSTGKVTKDGEWLYRFVGLFRDSGTQVDFVPTIASCWRPRYLATDDEYELDRARRLSKGQDRHHQRLPAA